MNPREYLKEAGKVVDESRTSGAEIPGSELEKVVKFLRALEDQGQGDVLEDQAELTTTLEELSDRTRAHGGSEPAFQDMRDLLAWTRDELENQTRLNRHR